jgi:hypothetical protein
MAEKKIATLESRAGTVIFREKRTIYLTSLPLAAYHLPHYNDD